MNIIPLLRRCHLPLLALVSLYQPLALLLCHNASGSAAMLILFPVLCLPMLMLCAAVSGRARPAVLCACTIGLLVAGHRLLPSGAAALIMPAGCAVILLYALSFAGKSPAHASPMFYFFCVLAQAAALFLLYHADDAVRGMPFMHGAFYLWLLLFLLAFNRISLNNATLSRYRLNTGMSAAGTLLTVSIFLLALLLCAMPAVVSGVIRFFAALRGASVALLLWIINLFPAESTGGSIAGGMPMLSMDIAADAAEPSRFAVVLEKIAAVFSVIVLIAGSALLLRLLALALVHLVRSILAHLKRCSAVITEDYEDEVTDTRADGGESAFLPLRRRTKQGISYPDTPAGRIRRRYAQLLARHGEWTQSSTARENLSSSAAPLYERARYSEHAPSAEDARRFEQETR